MKPNNPQLFEVRAIALWQWIAEHRVLGIRADYWANAAAAVFTLIVLYLLS
jgi:hypothetical protein